MTPIVDATGNLIEWRYGSDPQVGTLTIGSHSDMVPGGGRLNRIAGVLAEPEVAWALRDTGIALRHNLGIVDSSAQELSVFGWLVSGRAA
ncbi:hypothetical protein QEZ52_21525 (plasmid) [Aliisedimentitalea scapharcae]|uniref:N-carbamoyl-L-amino-acid hydrolase n=1 Tax=Aliisedimentitalea scapharcae TaxID=1524259 RepID=A0ABZ2Y346_9RHOB